MLNAIRLNDCEAPIEQREVIDTRQHRLMRRRRGHIRWVADRQARADNQMSARSARCRMIPLCADLCENPESELQQRFGIHRPDAAPVQAPLFSVFPLSASSLSESTQKDLGDAGRIRVINNQC